MPTAIIGGVAKTRIMRRISETALLSHFLTLPEPPCTQAMSSTSSSDLKTTMEKAGVKGTPQVWFATSAAK
jgi:hypothetical protein